MAKFELSFDKVSLDLSALDPKKLQKICEEEVSNTIQNTLEKWNAGKNPDGGSLKPGGYSESYKKAIQSKRLNKKGGSATPNLRLSGDLQESFRAVKITGGAEGRFEGEGRGRNISNASLISHHVANNGFKDPVGFGKDDEARIEKRFEEEVGKALDKMIKIEKGQA